MTTPASPHDHASALLEAARALHDAADHPASLAAAPDSLRALEETLQILSAAFYQLASCASPDVVDRMRRRVSAARSDGLSREQEVSLVATLHDVAAAFARCARTCRDGRTTVTPLIARRVAAGIDGDRRQGNELAWFESRRSTAQPVA